MQNYWAIILEPQLGIYDKFNYCYRTFLKDNQKFSELQAIELLAEYNLKDHLLHFVKVKKWLNI